MFKKKGEMDTKQALPKKKRKWGRIIAVVIVLVLVILLAVKCSTAGSTPLAVNVAEVKMGNVSAVLDTSGTIKSEDTRIYASPVSAAIAEVGVHVGDTVTAGTYLVTYNTDSLEENYNLAELEAKASKASTTGSVTKSNQNTQDKADAEATIADLTTQVANKQAELNQANADLNGVQQQSNSINAQLQQFSSGAAAGTLTPEELGTYQNLQQMSTSAANEVIAQQGNVTTKQTELSDLQSKLSEAQSKKATAEAGILSSQEQQSMDYNTQKTELSVTSAENNLSKAKAGIAAEFDGVVTDVQVTAGQMAQTGQTMVTVADSSKMKVEFRVSKYNLEEIAVGQKAEITFLNQTYTGSVTSISRVATLPDAASSATSKTAATAMVTAVVHIDDPDANLVIGMDAKMKIELGTKDNVLVVPLSAVNTNKDGDFVYVVENGVVAKRMIETGLSSSENVEVTSGLKEKEQVVSTVDATIAEGITVTPNLAESTEASGDAKAADEAAEDTEAVK